LIFLNSCYVEFYIYTKPFIGKLKIDYITEAMPMVSASSGKAANNANLIFDSTDLTAHIPVSIVRDEAGEQDHSNPRRDAGRGELLRQNSQAVPPNPRQITTV
jgi:hypothetical protein